MMTCSFKLLVLATLMALWLADAALIEPSLYSPEDNVKILNNDTLEQQLQNSTNCSFVQFINYFCGDCRRFAATFKRVSWKLYDWRRLLSVYVVDCAQERNVQICRDYNIRQTPTLRIFPPHFQRTQQDIGHEITTLEPSGIYAQLSEFVSKIKYTQHGQPNFAAVTAMENLFTADQDLIADCSSIAYTVLVYQPAHTTIGRDVLLELLTWPIVAVRILDNRQLFDNFGLNQFQDKLAIMDCLGNVLALQPTEDTKESYVASVVKYLQAAGYNADPPLPTTPAPSVSKYFMDEEQQAIISTVLQLQPKVYRADLEQAIDKLLHIELPKVRSFQGDNLLALQQLLNVLRLHNPLNANGKLLLDRLYNYVQTIEGELSGAAFQLQVENQQRKLHKVFKSQRYVGCVGSGPFLRGFTCSLWTLFHYLTVESASSKLLPPGAVLTAVHGFVQHFFGCKDCVQHFLEMAQRRQIFAVSQHDEEILWLWQAHNEVNQRIAGDSTEDPMFPKRQYPTANLCSKCQGPTWQQSEVLSFLKDVYSRRNLSSYGLPTPMGYD